MHEGRATSDSCRVRAARYICHGAKSRSCSFARRMRKKQRSTFESYQKGMNVYIPDTAIQWCRENGAFQETLWGHLPEREFCVACVVSFYAPMFCIQSVGEHHSTVDNFHHAPARSAGRWHWHSVQPTPSRRSMIEKYQSGGTRVKLHMAHKGLCVCRLCVRTAHRKIEAVVDEAEVPPLTPA